MASHASGYGHTDIYGACTSTQLEIDVVPMERTVSAWRTLRRMQRALCSCADYIASTGTVYPKQSPHEPIFRAINHSRTSNDAIVKLVAFVHLAASKWSGWVASPKAEHCKKYRHSLYHAETMAVEDLFLLIFSKPESRKDLFPEHQSSITPGQRSWQIFLCQAHSPQKRTFAYHHRAFLPTSSVETDWDPFQAGFCKQRQHTHDQQEAQQQIHDW